MLEAVVSPTLKTAVSEFAAYGVSHIHYPYNDSISRSNILARGIAIKRYTEKNVRAFSP